MKSSKSVEEGRPRRRKRAKVLLRLFVGIDFCMYSGGAFLL